MAGNDFINYCSYCGDRSICSVEFIDPQQAEILLEDSVSAWCKDCGIDGECPLKAGHHLKYNRVMAQLTEIPICIKTNCSNQASFNEYFPDSEGGQYWTMCDKCFNEQDGQDSLICCDCKKAISYCRTINHKNYCLGCAGRHEVE